MKFFSIKLLIMSVLISQTISGMDNPLDDGEHYHRFGNPQFHAAMKHIGEVAIPDDAEIIDIGCASGNVTAEIASLNPTARVLGIDLKGKRIATAQAKYSDRKNLAFRTLDATKMDYNNKFDRAYSFVTLHWIEDKEAFFANLHTSLKREGEFLLTVGTKKPELETVKAQVFGALFKQNPQWYTTLAKTDLVTGNNAVSRDELESLIKKAGFKDVQITEEISTHNFEDAQELANFFKTFLSDYKGISEFSPEEREKFIQTGAQKWIEAQPDRKIQYMWAQLVARGKKVTP